ncbi:MAG TPA: hypothetical protein VFO10_18460 [Oligoflexus sp.]|uniref:hypothetical protein n=1 Tax=Oligoflexus sp. TaxID=1971216 RepID=UPI002D7E6F51|nr:hypothetical protein [Oligoflexus sp.]HET9239249.1 hypothetical protein [Oligoflexus sp.]
MTIRKPLPASSNVISSSLRKLACFGFTAAPLLSLSSSTAHASVIVMPEKSNARTLGQGFIDSTKTIVPGCVSGEIERQPAEIASMEFSSGQEAEATLSSMSGKVKGSVNLLVAGASGSVHFVETKTNEQTGMSSFLNFTYAKYKARIKHPALTALGQGTLTRPADKILEICGSSVMNEATLGAHLSIVARFVYVGTREYKYSKSKVKAEVLGATVSKKSKVSESDEITKEFVLNVDAYQYGGDTSALKAILANGRKYCALSNPDACADTYKALLRYARHGFKDSVASADVNSLAALNITTTPYNELYLPVQFPVYTWKTSSLSFKNAAITAYRTTLAALLAEKEKTEARLHSGIFAGETEQSLTGKLNRLNDEIGAATDRINRCDFSGPNETWLCEF